jgi:hypothetical protein
MERDGTIRASWQTIRRAYGHCSRGCRAALIGMSTHQQTSLRLVFDPLKRS